MTIAIGLDVGGTNLRAARVDASGKIQAAIRRPTRRAAADVLDDCRSMIAELMLPEVRGIGVGLPCRVDPVARRVAAGGYVDLSALDPWAEISAETGLPITIENDATMALIGELAFGAARGMTSAVLLTIGTGIGGAIIDRGEVLRGKDTAGQLGHTIVRPGGRPCVCGWRGCVETESAGPAFALHLAAHGLDPETRVETLLRTESAAADAVLRDWSGPLRVVIDNLAVTLAPEAVLIGGGLGAAMVQALARVPKRAGGWFDPVIRAAALGDDAGVIGAAAAVLRNRDKRVVLVNGVPASGKSVVAQALAKATGWPVVTLDTVKEPFMQALQPVDRPFNRKLGQAAYQAMFGLLADAPAGTFILDAWFGFQPDAILSEGLARAGVASAVEIWCATQPEEIGRRYGARAEQRMPGHPGAEYVPELIALAGRAKPQGTRPVMIVDTGKDVDGASLSQWAKAALQR